MTPLHVPSQPGVLSLEERHVVPWASLRHAYSGGSRTNPWTGDRREVPTLDTWLAALAEADAEVRAEALSELDGCVQHQGHLYEATAYVVPFLCALAADPPADLELPLLGSLVSIAEATGFAGNVSLTELVRGAYVASRSHVDRLASRPGAPTVRAYLVAIAHGRPAPAFDEHELE